MISGKKFIFTESKSILLILPCKFTKSEILKRVCGVHKHRHFSSKFDFVAQLSYENFKISHPTTTNDVFKTLFCIKIHQQMADISSKEGWKTSNFSNSLENPYFLNYLLFFNLLLMISLPFVGRFWCKILF